jgi:hypothetical protein
MALMSTPAAALVSWRRVGTVTTLTNNQLCKTDGTDIICDTTTPTISSGLVGIGSVGPVVSLDLSQKTDALALPGLATGNAGRPTGGQLTNGEIRYNSATPGVEAYVSGSWVTLQSASGTWTGATITVPYGGTGDTTLTAHGVMLGEGTSNVSVTAAGAVGTVLIGQGSSADPIFSATPTVTNITVSGEAALTLGTDYTAVGTQSDVNLGAVSSVRYNGSAIATFEGLVAGTSGQILYLHNASNSTLTLSNQSGSESTLANRIITGTGQDLPVPGNTSVTLQYDGTGSRWRVTGSSNAAKALAAGSDTQIQYNDQGNMAGSSGLVYNYTSGYVGIGTTSPPAQLSIYETTNPIALGIANTCGIPGLNFGSATCGAGTAVMVDASGDMILNVPTGSVYDFRINNVSVAICAPH